LGNAEKPRKYSINCFWENSVSTRNPRKLSYLYLHETFNCFFEGKEIACLSLGKEIDKSAVLVKKKIKESNQSFFPYKDG